MKKISVTYATNSELQGSGIARFVPARVGWVRDWPRWASYAAVAWSLVYAALGLYWVTTIGGAACVRYVVVAHLAKLASHWSAMTQPVTRFKNCFDVLLLEKLV